MTNQDGGNTSERSLARLLVLANFIAVTWLACFKPESISEDRIAFQWLTALALLIIVSAVSLAGTAGGRSGR